MISPDFDCFYQAKEKGHEANGFMKQLVLKGGGDLEEGVRRVGTKKILRK